MGNTDLINDPSKGVNYRKRIRHSLSFPVYQTHKDSQEYNASDIAERVFHSYLVSYREKGKRQQDCIELDKTELRIL